MLCFIIIRKPKRPRNTNQLAKSIVALSTGEESEKPPWMMAERRSEIAQKAAKARWGSKDDKNI